MSDVAIRFDGLVLVASLVVATALFLIAALIAGVGTLIATKRRLRWRILARTALLLALLNLAALAATAAYIEYSGPPTGRDNIDWLALLVAILFAVGCVVLVRSGSGAQPAVQVAVVQEKSTREEGEL